MIFKYLSINKIKEMNRNQILKTEQSEELGRVREALRVLALPVKGAPRGTHVIRYHQGYDILRGIIDHDLTKKGREDLIGHLTDYRKVLVGHYNERVADVKRVKTEKKQSKLAPLSVELSFSYILTETIF